MLVKTSNLKGRALDWAVAISLGYKPINHSRLATVMVEKINARGVMSCDQVDSLKFSSDWGRGGPIIDDEFISINELAAGVIPSDKPYYTIGDLWCATKSVRDQDDIEMYGPTALIAATRCLVASRMGYEVDVPELLLADPVATYLGTRGPSYMT